MAFLPHQLNEYLVKVQIPSKTERYLRKLSRMEVTANLLIESNAAEIVKSFIAHPTLGPLARQIVDQWSQDASPLSSPSSAASSQGSSDAVISRKRRISHCESAPKRMRVNYQFTDREDEKQYRRFSDRVDEAIRIKALPDPSHPSYAGALADFVYSKEEQKENRPVLIPKKRTSPTAVKKPMTKSAPLMKKLMKVTGRK